MLALQGLDIPALIVFLILNVANLKRNSVMLELKKEKIAFSEAEGAASSTSLAGSKDERQFVQRRVNNGEGDCSEVLALPRVSDVQTGHTLIVSSLPGAFLQDMFHKVLQLRLASGLTEDITEIRDQTGKGPSKEDIELPIVEGIEDFRDKRARLSLQSIEVGSEPHGLTTIG